MAKASAKTFQTGAAVGGGSFTDQALVKRSNKTSHHLPNRPKGGGDLAGVMKGNMKMSAIPGGGTGPNSAWKFKTADGYAAGEEAQKSGAGTSIFDPVICELAYRWFCPPGGLVLDPFAGGSVRGIVAAKLGRRYLGIDLRMEQVEANRIQAAEILAAGEGPAEWMCLDSRELEFQVGAHSADFVFSCPPYGDLEVYSDDPRDLSTLDYETFREDYGVIIGAACGALKPDRFASFVVGDFRDDAGFYRNFIGHTVEAFEAAGLRLYNEAILVTAVGSLPIRAGKQFQATRKLGKTHQNVLVFCKGDPRRATEAVGPVEFGELPTEDGQFVVLES